MKRFLVLLLVFLLTFSTATILTACGETTEETPHTHTFETTWTSDETHHYKKATCEHTTEVSEKAEHVFGNDEKCDICGYEKVQGGNEQDDEEQDIYSILINVLDFSKYENLKVEGQLYNKDYDYVSSENVVFMYDSTGIGVENDWNDIQGTNIFVKKVGDKFIRTDIKTQYTQPTSTNIDKKEYVGENTIKNRQLENLGQIFDNKDFFQSEEKLKDRMYQMLASTVCYGTTSELNKTDVEYDFKTTEENRQFKFNAKICPKNSWFEKDPNMKVATMIYELVFTEAEIKSYSLDMVITFVEDGDETGFASKINASFSQVFDMQLYNETVAKENGLSYEDEISYMTVPVILYVNGLEWDIATCPFNENANTVIDKLIEDFTMSLNSYEPNTYEIKCYLDNNGVNLYDKNVDVKPNIDNGKSIYLTFSAKDNKVAIVTAKGLTMVGSEMLLMNETHIVEKINDFSLSELTSLVGVGSIEVNGVEIPKDTTSLNLNEYGNSISIVVYYENYDYLYKS